MEVELDTEGRSALTTNEGEQTPERCGAARELRSGGREERRRVRRRDVLAWLEDWHVPTAQISVRTVEPDVLHSPRPEASDVAGNLWWRAVWFAGPGHIYEPDEYRGRATPAWKPKVVR